MPLFRHASRVALVGLSLFAASHASTIVSVTGVNAGGFLLSGIQVVGASWTQTNNYTDVAISAVLNGITTDTVTAYLTTQIGPGTTTASEVARTTASLPGVFLQGVMLFQIPLLSSGTYYLTLSDAGNSFDSWGDTATGLIAVDSGVTRNSDYAFTNFGGNPPAAYAPATPFLIQSSAPGAPILEYQVTGTAVPEPGTASLFGMVAVGLVVWKRGALRLRRRTVGKTPHQTAHLSYVLGTETPAGCRGIGLHLCH
jgi:hypothetical protein